MLKCPCNNCPCVAICRLKLYARLVECELLAKYITYYRVPIATYDPSWRIPIFDSLRPTTWTIDVNSGRFDKPYLDWMLLE
jgi:hypothetical protein